MKFLSAAWENVYGLLVEDGQIALGTLAAFVIAALWAAFAGPDLHDSAGTLLFVLLMCLLLANLYATGRRAANRDR